MAIFVRPEWAAGRAWIFVEVVMSILGDYRAVV